MFPFLAALLLAAAPEPSAPADSVASDSVAASVRDSTRIVRRFPAIEVSAGRIHDMRSSATVHVVSSEALRDLPVSSLAQVLALQAGVVAIGEDIHVRGGRAGETQWTVNGLVMNEPFHDQAPELPLLSVQRADLLAGGLDAEYAGALAGVLDVRTFNPEKKPSGAFRWLTTGRVGTAFDWFGARGSAPIPRTGLGIVAAGEARLDDQFLPGRPSRGRQEILGRRFGWRNDDHLLGWAKLAPIERPQSASIEVFASRVVSQPFDPMFKWNDSVMVYTMTPPPPGPPSPPIVDSMNVFYRAADHQPMTETRRWTTLAQVSRLDDRKSWRAAFAWQHGTSLTSPGLTNDPRDLYSYEKLRFGQDMDPERSPFLAYAGDWAYFRRTRFDRLQAALTGGFVLPPRSRFGFGVGALWDNVLFYELDAVEPTDPRIDTLRTFHTRAPGGWAYVQHRWEREGLVWNGGLRLQMFTAGDEARVPAGVSPTGVRPDTRGIGAQWTLSPRLGIAYPITSRDALSLSYARIHQSPGREYLADDRLLVYSRRPLGDPRLIPSELVTYQASLKHLFYDRWAVQVSVFQRDLYGQIGVVNDPYFGGTFRPRYSNSEYGHATGYEVTLLAGVRKNEWEPWSSGSILRRLLRGEFSLRYTYMTANGTMSGTDGWYYGRPFGFRPLPIGEHPLDWDREHMVGFDAVWREPRVFTFGWVTQLASSPRWTPTVSQVGDPSGPLVAPDLAAVNSRTLPGSERTDVVLRLEPPALRGAKLLLEVRNLFNSRGQAFVSVNGFPNPAINTLRDDYAGWRTETGNGGGAYWDPRLNGGRGGWVPVDDPRLAKHPRSIRFGIEAGL